MSLVYHTQAPVRPQPARPPIPSSPVVNAHPDDLDGHPSAMVLRDAPMPPSDHPKPTQARRSVRFELGRICVTSNAMMALESLEIVGALARHARGDWGTLPTEDWLANERAVRDGDRLVSVYHTPAGVKFYVVTEWDRSVTTVLLPEDY